MLFPLGTTVITRNALNTALEKQINVADLVRRHARGDWGEVCPYDAALNKQAIDLGNRIFSKYTVGGIKFFIITEWDRSVTTTMLAEDY